MPTASLPELVAAAVADSVPVLAEFDIGAVPELVPDPSGVEALLLIIVVLIIVVLALADIGIEVDVDSPPMPTPVAFAADVGTPALEMVAVLGPVLSGPVAVVEKTEPAPPITSMYTALQVTAQLRSYRLKNVPERHCQNWTLSVFRHKYAKRFRRWALYDAMPEYPILCSRRLDGTIKHRCLTNVIHGRMKYTYDSIAAKS